MLLASSVASQARGCSPTLSRALQLWGGSHSSRLLSGTLDPPLLPPPHTPNPHQVSEVPNTNGGVVVKMLSDNDEWKKPNEGSQVTIR